MKCHQCGAENPDAYNFCGGCGTSLFKQKPSLSSPQLLLLSKFLKPRGTDDFDREEWTLVLNEDARQAIGRWLNDGLLTRADLIECIMFKYTSAELKEMLRLRSLLSATRKKDMATTLVGADEKAMQQAIGGLVVLQCTDAGQAIAEKYIATEKDRRAQVEQQVIDALRKRKFREASLKVATFEAEQVFWRGVGIDWLNYSPHRDMEVLKTIFGTVPRILKTIEEPALEELRIAAAMMHLWGTNNPAKWLPTDFESGLAMNNDVAARMLMFQGSSKGNLNGYRANSDILKGVRVCAASNSCPNCQAIAKWKYRFEDVPELPYENCTHKKGCRCVLAPVTKTYREIGINVDLPDLNDDIEWYRPN